MQLIEMKITYKNINSYVNHLIDGFISSSNRLTQKLI